MIFSIIIPAYNEEDAVLDILKRSLAAAEKLKAAGLGFDDVEILLVNDGSRDKTGTLAKTVSGVRVIDHPVNRGCGAAIKTGFRNARGEWVGFIDSDGTCDPLFFIDLLKLAFRDNLDISVGSRMHPGTGMPAVRILGNWIFRTLVNAIGNTEITDIASGMRVIRTSALPRIEPLPDGMSITPAMSMRAALDPSLKMGETFMPYEERVGRSKLSVIRDGFRFLGVIIDTAVTFRPLLFFGTAATALAAGSAWSLLARWGAPASVLPFYLQNGRIEDRMIYRVIFATLLLSASVFLLALGAAAEPLVGLVNHDERPTRGRRLVDALLTRRFLPWSAVCFAAAIFLNRRLLASYFETGQIPMDYWMFPIVGGLLALTGVEFLAFGFMSRITRLLHERRRGAERDRREG